MKGGISRLQRQSDSRTRIRPVFLLALVLVSALSVVLVLLSRHTSHTDYYDVQLDAAQRMHRCERFLHDYVVENGIEIEPEDLNRTGLIGPEISELMTTLGHIDAKRSTLNPNNAALLVKFFKQSGLKEGDVVAIGSSGSFPAMAIATICACNAMGLEARTIASYGASTYGATRVELNVVKILKLLKDEKLIDFNLLAVSPGSNNDYGVGSLDGLLYDNTRDVVVALGRSEGVEFIDFNDFAKSIKRRLELYGDDVDIFVNVGGAGVNTGTSMEYLDLPPGLSMKVETIPEGDTKGVLYEYAQRGLPVINILNIKRMSLDNGLPFDPVPLPSPGEGGVYYETVYSRALIVIGIVLTFALAIWAVLDGRRHK